jgi:hypothetical protein
MRNPTRDHYRRGAPRVRVDWRRIVFVQAAFLAVLVACADPIRHDPVAVDETVSLTAALTAEAASQMVDGGFPGVPSIREGAITPERARMIAEAWLDQFAAYNWTAIERQHGGPIDASRLRASDRILLAESPYGDLPADAPVPVRNVLSDYYLIAFEDDGVPKLVVGVSAAASGVKLLDDRIVFTTHSGNEFRVSGIPQRYREQITIEPERAVLIAYSAYGARVASPPRFITRGFRYSPILGTWKVDLEDSTVALVGWDGSILVPATEQPVAESIGIRSPVDGTRSTLVVPLRPGMPTNVESERLR